MRMLIPVCLAAVMLSGCIEVPLGGEPVSTPALKSAALAVDLTGRYTNPDGMCLKDGWVYVVMNNLASGKPAKIVRISPDDKMEEVIELSVHPKTGVVSPLGIVFAKDGALYVNDNQNFAGKGLGLSRILKVSFERHRAVKVETVAEGINEANGMTTFGEFLYITDTTFGTKNPHTSGVYRFALSELVPEKPVQVKAGPEDPHCIGSFATTGKWPVGANGITADSAGNLFVCNFGDAVLWKMKFEPCGKVKEFKPFVDCRPFGAESLDGAQYDGEGGIWIADFIGNAVVRVDTATAAVKIIAKNLPGDGKDGSLDAPSECIRRGNRIYVSNIDLTFGPNTADAFQSISVIQHRD